jgi:hypothetical protein
MNLNFPTSPSIGDTYQFGSSPTYIYNGERWVITYQTLDETPKQPHWVNGSTPIIRSGKIVTIASDYVLIDSELTLEGNSSDGYGSDVTISNKTYNRNAKLSVFGDLVLYDTLVINDGEIRVDGGLILEDDAIIVGDGIII